MCGFYMKMCCLFYKSIIHTQLQLIIAMCSGLFDVMLNDWLKYLEYNEFGYKRFIDKRCGRV